MKRIVTFSESNYDVKEVTLKFNKKEYYAFVGTIYNIVESETDEVLKEVLKNFLKDNENFKSRWVK